LVPITLLSRVGINSVEPAEVPRTPAPAGGDDWHAPQSANCKTVVQV
jgi:hypothetical protein